MNYGYVEEDYYVSGYTTSGLGTGIQFKATGLATLTFAKGFKYSENALKFFQAIDVTSANYPIHTASKLKQIEFEATFPLMTDSELNAFRTFMFTDLALFQTFELIMLLNYVSINVKFKERKIKVTQLLNNFNEVTVSFIKV